MNSTITNFSATPKKEWIKPEVKGFDLSNTEGGRYSFIHVEDTFYHT